MLGGITTVKLTPLLDSAPTVTTTVPVVAPLGTVTLMLVALQAEAVAVVPLNATVLAPCVAPKLRPVMVTAVPAAPEVRLRLVMKGATVKATPLLAPPLTVTTMLPEVAPLGTLTVMLVALQAVAVPADVPLNVTVLLPWDAPKFVPVMVRLLPIEPDAELRLVIEGEGSTVKATPLLASPPTVTTTLPVLAALGTVTVMLVALQTEAVPADVPLKVTVLVPCEAPKFVPVMVTDAPTGA